MKWVGLTRARELGRDKGAYQMPVERVFTDFKIYTTVRSNAALSDVVSNNKSLLIAGCGID